MNRKRGFTILELIIVIAVIAILAAVMIPTFNSIANKTKQSSDIQMVRSLNAALQADRKKHGTMYDALICVEKSGFTLASITNNELPDHVIAWESTKDRFVLINTKTDKCVFPKSEYKGEGSDVITNKYKYFVVYDEVPSIEEQSYSIYLSDTARISDVAVVVGFDAGTNRYVKNLTYDRSGADSAQNVIIRTNDNGTTCEFNGYVNPSNSSKGDTIHHYGNSGNQVISSADDSYHEHGAALAVEVKKGHYAQEKGSIVSVLNASASEGDVRVELKNGSIQGTVKNTNDQNAVTIVSASNVVTVNIEVKTDGGELKVSLLSQPYYANTHDCDVTNTNSKKVLVTGIGETKGENDSTAPGSESVCGNGHRFITIAGSSVKICTHCSAYEYTLSDTIEVNESELSDIVEKTYICLRNNDGTTQVIKSHDHSFGDPEWLWNGYESASATFACTDEDCNRVETVIVPKDSGFISYEVTTEPTCTATGLKTYTAKLTHHGVDFESVSPSEEVLEALGHNYEESVTEPTCTEQGYTRHTCSRCNHSYDDTYTEVVAHNYLEAVTLPTCVDEGYTTYTCSWCGKRYVSDPVPATGHSGNPCSVCGAQSISVVFPNTDKYLYRVGNQNIVSISSLFTGYDNDTIFTIENVHGDASGLYIEGDVSFTGTGVVKVTADNSVDLLLEVVDAYNAISAMNASDKNVCLLNNINGSFTVSEGHTLYGNGFTISISGAGSAKTLASEGMARLESGTIDNAVIVCDVFPVGYMYKSEASEDSQGYADYRRPALLITGPAKLVNSYVSGARAAVCVNSRNYDVQIINSTLEGGSLCNLEIQSVGELLLEDLTTIQIPTASTYGNHNDVCGLGILSVNTSTNPRVVLKGDLRQYNWASKSFKSYVPNIYQPLVDVAFKQTEFVHNINGSDYVNLGMIFCNGETLNIEDERINRLTVLYAQKSVQYMTATATVFTVGSGFTVDESRFNTSTVLPYEPAAQLEVAPKVIKDFTSKNYISKDGVDDEDYCFYDSSDGKVKISKKQANASDTFSYDPMILDVSKYGYGLNYTVKISGTDCTNKLISFSESGLYTLRYSFIDPYVCDKNGDLKEKEYIIELTLDVTLVEPDSIVYHPEFSYAGEWSSCNSKSVVVEGDVYIMPDVSGTSSKIGSTTVSGITVYYPIVTVNGKNSSGNNYSSGKIYMFAPAFSAINIKDLNKDTGATLYTYNSATQKWPHNIGATTGPGNSKYYGPASTRDPYGAATGTKYEKYAYNKNNGGLCFTSNEIERNVTANTKLVRFHYVGNDGITYYYYIQYNYNAVTYSGGGSCFAPGTCITLADGSQKPIEQLSFEDKILAWDFIGGECVSKAIALLVDHGTSEYDVTNMIFSDGTVLRTIGEHGLFDYDLNKFVYIVPENCNDFTGHSFVKDTGNGDYTVVKLTEVFVTTEITNAYSITSAQTMNAFAEGILTVAPPEDFYTWITMGDKLRYDLEVFYADVEQYGLYTYEDFKDYVTYEQFVAWGGAYLKVPVEKGYFTFDYIIELIELYKQWMPENSCDA